MWKLKLTNVGYHCSQYPDSNQIVHILTIAILNRFIEVIWSAENYPSRWTRSCTHESQEDLTFLGVSDFFLMLRLDRRSHGTFIHKSVCVKRSLSLCKTRTLAYGTTACYRIGCIIVLLLFTASTFLIVSHAQEQMSSLVSPTRHYECFKREAV